MEKRNVKMEIKRKEREEELLLKEMLEAEELAKKQMHKPGQKLDISSFNKKYQD